MKLSENFFKFFSLEITSILLKNLESTQHSSLFLNAGFEELEETPQQERFWHFEQNSSSEL